MVELQLFQVENWMCVEARFCQIRSHIHNLTKTEYYQIRAIMHVCNHASLAKSLLQDRVSYITAKCLSSVCSYNFVPLTGDLLLQLRPINFHF